MTELTAENTAAYLGETGRVPQATRSGRAS